MFQARQGATETVVNSTLPALKKLSVKAPSLSFPKASDLYFLQKPYEQFHFCNGSIMGSG